MIHHRKYKTLDLAILAGFLLTFLGARFWEEVMIWTFRGLGQNSWMLLLNADVPRVMDSRVFPCRGSKITEPRPWAQAGPEATPWEGTGEGPLHC